ncbi:MAG: LacI family DNA-binding transcriptional regulator [Proteobacteria bacterium]|nr:LacI family DNA-binding transcriptional regulator [Burkholderiales bacterium]
MSDVARVARVSLMTVSRVLREPDKVLDVTRERVDAAIRQTGYVHNALAGGLRSQGRTKVVAAVVPSVRNSLFAGTLQGLADALRADGLRLALGDSDYSKAEETALIRAFLSLRPSGLVVHDAIRSTALRSVLARAAIPVVEVGDLSRRPFDLAVSYSNRLAAATMTRHLLERGYRRIGFVSLSPRLTRRALERLTGFETALREAGLEPDPELIAEAQPGFAEGGRTLVELVARRARPADAVFFAGDVHGIGAILEARRQGWDVPGKVAIAAFDDVEIAPEITPALTCLRIPRYEIGFEAGRRIIARLHGDPDESTRAVDLGFRLIVRAST